MWIENMQYYKEMISSDQIAKLCRDAAYGDYPWGRLLGNIAEWVGGDRAMLFHSTSVTGYNHSISYNHDPEMEKLYNERFFHLDPRAPVCMNFKVGETYTGQQIVPNESFKHTEYYSEVTLKADVKDSVHGVISDDPELGRRAISVQRSFKSEFFGKADLEKLSFIMSHLDQAFRDSLRVAPILAQHDASQALAYGLIDPALHLHFFDGTELRPEEFLHIDPTGQRLMVANEALASILPGAIRDAARGRRHNIRLASSLLSLAPAPLALGWTGLDEIAFFIMSKPELAADASLFSAAFKLTQREGQILDQLLINQDRERICGRLSISNETLRWHIKNMLSKCGYSNGADLVHAALHNNLSNCP